MDVERVVRTTEGMIDRLARLREDPVPKVPVLSAKIKLLWQCNLSCAYCVRPPAIDPMPRSIATTLLRTLAAQGLRKVHFSGGEVFLHPEIFAILEDAASLGLQVNLTTNGTLLDRSKINALADTGVHSISFSLDSADPKTHDKLRGKKGAFKATVKAIRLIADSPRPKMKLRINTVVNSRNAAGMDGLHELIASFGSGVRWKIIPVDSPSKSLLLEPGLLAELAAKAAGWNELDDRHPFGRSEDDFLCYSRGWYGARQSRCYIPWVHLFVDPAGFCYPCCMSRGKVPALGRFPHDPLERILGGDAASQLKMMLASDSALAVCRNCDDFLEENAVIGNLITNHKNQQVVDSRQ